MARVQDLKIDIKREVIAVDGKTMRGSADKQGGFKAAHMVSARATENRAEGGHSNDRRRGLKSGECQYRIADQIVGAGGDYLFSLKGNQRTLEEDVELYFRDIDFEKPEAGVQVYTTYEVDHGRLERRKHAVTGDVQWLTERHPNWKTIHSIGVIEEKREIGKGGDKVSVDRRLYVSSLPADAELLAFAARARWGIENPLHYILCGVSGKRLPDKQGFFTGEPVRYPQIGHDVGSR